MRAQLTFLLMFSVACSCDDMDAPEDAAADMVLVDSDATSPQDSAKADLDGDIGIDVTRDQRVDGLVDGDLADAPATSIDRMAAFPTACGYGAQPRDWSDARREYVTNLNDSGPGSLRAALLATGKRIVIFKVGGTIRLENIILMDSTRSDVYVAGQTAPGDGIQVLGPATGSGHLIRLRGTADGPFNNGIFRYLSWRGQKAAAASGDVFAVQTSTNVVLDHCSLAFSSDEILGFTALSCEFPQLGGLFGQHDIGVTNNLVAEPFEPHTTAALFGSIPTDENLQFCPIVTDYLRTPKSSAPFDASVMSEGSRDAWPGMTEFRRLTIHRNVFSSATHRSPLLATVNTSYTNNIAYGAELGNLLTQGAAEIDAVGNMYLVHAGVVASPIYNVFLQQRMFFTGGNRYSLNNPNAFFDLPASIYMVGAYLETAPNVGSIIDPWSATNNVPDYWQERVGSESDVTSAPDIFDGNWPCDGSDWRCNLNARRDTPLHAPNGSEDSPQACDVQTTPDQSLIDSVLDNAGNSRRVSCDGTWMARRQPTDIRQVDNVRNRSDSVGGARPIGTQNGINYPQRASITPKTIDEVGGYDVLDGGQGCADSDMDGMPDAFETRYGFDSNVDDAMMDSDSDGYTNLEEWFNGTKPVLN